MKLLYSTYDVTVSDSVLKHLDIAGHRLGRGHSISDEAVDSVDKIYFFNQGTGVMIVNNHTFRVGSSSVVLVPQGSTATVVNDGEMNLLFNVVANSNV